MTSARRFVAAAMVAGLLVGLGAGWFSRGSDGDQEPLRAKRIVLFTMPGVTWSDVSKSMPNLRAMQSAGASAALAVRSAEVAPSPARGFLTLGAGNRADASARDPIDEAKKVSSGQIVQPGMAELQAAQDRLYHGTTVGALGQALADAGITRSVFSLADLSLDTESARDMRRSPVLAIVDEEGTVDNGMVSGPLRPDQAASDIVRLAIHVELGRGQVMLFEAGETMRAEEAARAHPRERALAARDAAIRRTDELVGEFQKFLKSGDLLLVLAPSSPNLRAEREHLTAIVAWTRGIRPGELVSSTTRRPGIVTLTDVAPTVLSALGVPRPDSMSGRPMMRAATPANGRIVRHDDLDHSSRFRERFAPGVFYALVGIFAALLALGGLAFVSGRAVPRSLTALCYLGLATPLATFLLNIVPAWRWELVGAHTALWCTAIALAALAWLVPGPRWIAAAALLGATFAFVAGALLMGGVLMTNAVFGNSVMSAGRFYGIPNTGSAIFFGAGVVAVAALVQLGPDNARFLRAALGFAVVLLLIGLPAWGADFGGFAAGVVAVGVGMSAARAKPVGLRVFIIAALAAVAATVGLALLDSLRAPDLQTHLGRFADSVLSGDGTAPDTILRKARQSFSSLGFSPFTYLVVLGAATVSVILTRPRGRLREALSDAPWLRAALAALLTGGVLGFALNDSGVAVPALLLTQAVPVLLLLGLDRGQARVLPASAEPRAQTLQRKERYDADQM